MGALYPISDLPGKHEKWKDTWRKGFVRTAGKLVLLPMLALAFSAAVPGKLAFDAFLCAGSDTTTVCTALSEGHDTQVGSTKLKI